MCKRQLMIVAGALVGILGATRAGAETVQFGFTGAKTNTGQDLSSTLMLQIEDSPGSPGSVDVTFTKFGADAAQLSRILMVGGPLGAGEVVQQQGMHLMWGQRVTNASQGAQQPPTVNPSTSWQSTNTTDPQRITIRFALNAGATMADVCDAVTGTKERPAWLRAALEVVWPLDGTKGNNTYTATVVPLPPGAWSGAACLAAIVGAGVVRGMRHRVP